MRIHIFCRYCRSCIIRWIVYKGTVKLVLTTTSKILSSAQDDCFRSVRMFLVWITSIKQSIKDDHLSSVTATTPNLDRKGPKNYQRRQAHFCAACFSMSANIVFGHVRKLFYKEPFKKITCLIWQIYIGTQGGCLIQV